MEWKQEHFVHRCSMKDAWTKELFYSNMYPLNSVVYAIDTDRHLNLKDDNTVEYKFNEYGFRSDSFNKPSQIKILTSGCSLTVGVGVNENWTEKLKYKIQEHTSNTVTACSVATSGASCEYVTRSIYKVHAILKPDLIFVYWPPISRLELPNNQYDENIEQMFLNDPRDKAIPGRMATLQYFQLDADKNRSFLHMFTNVFDNNNDIYFDSYARDKQHPDEEWHERVAQMFFEQYIAK